MNPSREADVCPRAVHGDGMDPTVAVVMAGGRGTRLYPAAAPDRPKQFQRIAGDRSLLERTVARARGLAEETVVLTRPAYADQVRSRVDCEVLVEPEPKDTGPALVYASHRLRDRAETMVCLPADHHVGDEAALASGVRRMIDAARTSDALALLGVAARSAATGYGYIDAGGEVDAGLKTVRGFREKPEPAVAASYYERGMLWNAGIFAWQPAAFLDACENTPLGPLVERLDSGQPEPFATIPSTSVDEAVLERADPVVVAEVAAEWADLGTWDSLASVCESDANGTVVDGDALTIDTEDCVISTDDTHHVATIGVSNLVVAAYDGRVLVLPQSATERVREVWKAVHG